MATLMRVLLSPSFKLVIYWTKIKLFDFFKVIKMIEHYKKYKILHV